MKRFVGYISEYFKNKALRFHVSIFAGLILNTCYIIFNLVSGIIYGNVWFITVAAYYTLAVSVRYLILGSHRSDRDDIDFMIESARATKICGTLMLILGVPITGMIIYTVISNRSYEYSAVVFILLFVYALFSVTRASLGIFSSKKKSSATRVAHLVRLSSALLSLFNLQTSVFSVLRVSDNVVIILNFITGGAVSLLVFWLSAKTVAESDRKLNELTVKRKMYK